MAASGKTGSGDWGGRRHTAKEPGTQDILFHAAPGDSEAAPVTAATPGKAREGSGLGGFVRRGFDLKPVILGERAAHDAPQIPETPFRAFPLSIREPQAPVVQNLAPQGVDGFSPPLLRQPGLQFDCACQKNPPRKC